MASERVTMTAAMLYDAGREDGRRDAAAEIARLSRELEAALERERRLRDALLTLLTAVDRACGTAIPQGSFGAARKAARDAIAEATGANN